MLLSEFINILQVIKKQTGDPEIEILMDEDCPGISYSSYEPEVLYDPVDHIVRINKGIHMYDYEEGECED